MIICFTLNGVRHCFTIPIYRIPIDFPPHPDPGNYADLIRDATILATINQAVSQIGNKDVQQALHHGVSAGLKSMQEVAGKEVSISLSKPELR
jgi:hypothetical protein